MSCPARLPHGVPRGVQAWRRPASGSSLVCCRCRGGTVASRPLSWLLKKPLRAEQELFFLAA